MTFSPCLVERDAFQAFRRRHRITFLIEFGSSQQMAAKKIAFDQEAREAMQRGVAKLARAVKVTLGPRAATSSSRSPSARPPSPRTASPSPRRSSSRTSTRTWAPRWSRRSPARPATSPATARPPRPSWPRPSTTRACKAVVAGRQPDAHEARHGQGGRRHRRAAQEDEHQGHEQDRDRAGRAPSPPTTTPRSAR